MNRSIIIAIFSLLHQVSFAQSTWKPAAGPLTTQWAENVGPHNVHKEYPRPQMVRKEWKNLNGLWDYSIVPLFEKPSQWDGQILVPFPVESMLSGVGKKVGTQHMLWYKRSFTVPSTWKQQRILLHFEAVDWRTTVWVNGKEMGQHEGGRCHFPALAESNCLYGIALFFFLFRK